MSCLKCYECDAAGCAAGVTSDMEKECPAASGGAEISCIKTEALGKFGEESRRGREYGVFRCQTAAKQVNGW